MFKFKFKPLNGQGSPTGFFSKKGIFDGETLLLDQIEVPAAHMVAVESRNKHVVIVEAEDIENPTSHLFVLTRGSEDELKQILGVARSAAQAARRQEELQKEGRGHEYREVICPHCDATNDLTGFAESPQTECQFCDTVFGCDDPVAEEKKYRLCDECARYSKPRHFTIFYFYFLLVVYGWSSRPTWRCPGCMRGEAWKMLAGNLIFVLGVPVAIVQLIRAYGGTDLSSMYKGLDSANVKARKGQLEAAVGDYRKILDQYPNSAGIKYNVGLAFVEQNRLDAAITTLEAALADCANYEPAANLLAHCYTETGDTEKLAELKNQWGAAEDEPMAVEDDPLSSGEDD